RTRRQGQDRGTDQGLRGPLCQPARGRREGVHRRGDHAAFHPQAGDARLRFAAHQEAQPPLQEARHYSAMTTRPRTSSPLSCRAARAASPLWRRLARGSAALAVFLMAGAMAAADDVLIPVPSGQPVTYLDTVHNALGAEGLTIRFRFVAPEIAREGGAVPASVAQADMAFLCETYALPRVASTGPQPRQVII